MTVLQPVISALGMSNVIPTLSLPPPVTLPTLQTYHSVATFPAVHSYMEHSPVASTHSGLRAFIMINQILYSESLYPLDLPPIARHERSRTLNVEVVIRTSFELFLSTVACTFLILIGAAVTAIRSIFRSQI